MTEQLTLGLFRFGLQDQQDTAEVMLCLLLRLVTNHTVASVLVPFSFLFSSLSGGCQLPRAMYAEANTEKNWIFCNNHIDEFGNGPPASTNCLDGCSLSQQLDLIVMRDNESELPCQVSPWFLTHRSYKIIDVCCLKLLSFNLLGSNR